VADVQAKRSDLSGQLGESSEFGRLVVLDHPSFKQRAVLDARAEEVKDLRGIEDLVVLEWQPPEGEPQRLAVPLQEFQAKFGDEDKMNADLMSAVASAVAPPRRQRGRPRKEGQPTARRSTSGIDWTSPENAGLPHRGRVTKAEAAYVREHLKEVNERRAALPKPAPPIDPNNPDDRTRYWPEESAAPSGS